MAWYKTGTISVTNGSATVTGSGTTWVANAAIGEALYAPDGRLYEIVNIASDTSMTIAPAYLGSNQTGQAYVIVPSQSYIRDLAAQAADLVNNYSTIANTVGVGKFSDGTLAAPGIRFSDDLDTGFYRSGTNEVTFVAGGVAQFKYNTSGISYITSPDFTTPITVTTNSSDDAFRITQTGSGNALVVEDSANPDSTPFVIGNDGTTVVGGGLPLLAIETISPKLAVSGANNTEDAIGIYNYRNAGGSGRTTVAPRLFFARSRSGVNGTIGGVVVDNEDIGNIRFAGDDGTQFLTAAEILAEVDGTPGTNDMPGRLVFSTTADGASSPTEAMRINSQQNIAFGYTGANQAYHFLDAKNISGGAGAGGFNVSAQIRSNVTSIAIGYATNLSTEATSFTCANIQHYRASQATIGAGSTVTSQYGYAAESSLTGATNNYGFYSNIATATGRYNFYAAGSAPNYFAGNVGIGTTSIVNKVNISNNSTVSWENSSNSYAVGTAGFRILKANDNNCYIDNFEGDIAIRRSGFLRSMTIDSSGNVSVGAFNETGATSGRRTLQIGLSQSSRDGTNSLQHLSFFNPNGGVGSITTSGSATAYNTSSDYRLKEDVQPMSGNIDRLMALNPVNFAWKVDGSRVDGFLAHEAQEIVPEAVTGAKDAVDDEGNPDYQAIDQSKLVPLLTAALQDAIKRIEALEAQLQGN